MSELKDKIVQINLNLPLTAGPTTEYHLSSNKFHSFDITIKITKIFLTDGI